MLPSLSSASITNQSPFPTKAFPINPFSCNRIKPAPLIILGSRSAYSRISKIIAVVVLFPLVPPTAIVFFVTLIAFNNSLLFMIGILRERAFCISLLVSSTAVEITIKSILELIPLAS